MYVHSLVKPNDSKPAGWYAPLELGDDSPIYVSFALPLEAGNRLADAYQCEVVQIDGTRRSVTTHRLVKSGEDAFVLKLPDRGDVWFTLQSGAAGIRLPYAGKLQHADFSNPLVEIEPADQAVMDRLCNEHGLFVVGCDPFKHYTGELLSKSNETASR